MKPAPLAYLVLLHVALAALVVKGDFVHRAALRLGMSQESDAPFIEDMRRLHEWSDPHVPNGAVIFLGDSITQALPTAAVAPLSVNYGIAGQRSDQLLKSMSLYHSMARARAVVVMIGTNDVWQGKEGGLEGRYRAILSKVPAGVPVLFNSIPPISGRDTAHIVQAARLACLDSVRCTFLDTNAALRAPDSLAADGIHLSQAGYRRWIEALHVLATSCWAKQSSGTLEPARECTPHHQ